MAFSRAGFFVRGSTCSSPEARASAPLAQPSGSAHIRQMRLTTLDLISLVMDRPTRRLDFAIVLRMRTAPDRSALESGAASARFRFPTSGAIVRGDEWHWPGVVADMLERRLPAQDHHAHIRRFVDERWDLGATPAVQQLVLREDHGEGATLVTRFHHACCDGTSAIMWLRHQLGVATGAEEMVRERQACAPPALRCHPRPARRSAFAFARPADRLRTRETRASGRRDWRTIDVPVAPLRELADRMGGVTYNDLLAASALSAFRQFNEARSTAQPAIGLWMPMDIRNGGESVFGNGSSRIRVYDRAAKGSLAERATSVREQVGWSRANGEWAVPHALRVRALPIPLLRVILRTYLERPWADMGTGTFSHLERSALDEPAFADVVGMDVIGMLDPRHAVGIFAMTRRGVTHLTFVHDPERINDGELAELISHFRSGPDAPRTIEGACAAR